MQEKLSKQEILRYSRHLLLPEVGVSGQRKLKDSKVLIVGAGGLGCPAALYLAAAGVGEIGLMDFDTVEASNLQRQILYATEDQTQMKVTIAARQLERLNPYVRVHTHNVRLTPENAVDIFSCYDLVVDGTDSFKTRYLAHDAAFLTGKPYIYGSVFRFEGQASVFDGDRGPCYRCLFPEPPPTGALPNCAEGGVLGVLPGQIGLIQATEAVKLILGIGTSLLGRLLVYDALAMTFDSIKVSKVVDCLLCGKEPHYLNLDHHRQPEPAIREVPGIAPGELQLLLQQGTEIQLVDVRQPAEAALARIEGSRLIPLGQLLTLHNPDLHLEDEIIIYCKTGSRSARAAWALIERGYLKVRSLKGGINAWRQDIDPALAEY